MTATTDTTLERMALLVGWLNTRLTREQRAWVDDQVQRIATSGGETARAMAIGLAPRKLSKADLALDAAELEAAVALRSGLDPSDWSVDQAARILFVLASFDGDEAAFAARFDNLMTKGEVGEHIALLRGLPLYPAPKRLLARAAEGVRSAMQPVFEAVAHANPFPREEFSETQWNQMVVKALFIGSRLAPILGLDERRNPDLAKMLIDYAHERWAAGRSVSPELWRCVGLFARESDVEDLAKVLTEGTPIEQKAAALALAECALPSAGAALRTAPALAPAIRQGEIAWHDIA
jgi:hypothetical protein